MEEGSRYIELKVELGDHPDLLDFAAIITAIGDHFRDYVRRRHPEIDGRAFLGIERLERGCIVVHMLPMVLPLIQHMDYFLIVDGFVSRFRQVVTSLRDGIRPPEASTEELKAVLSAVGAISRQRTNKGSVSAMEYNKTKTTTHLRVEFDGDTAREIRDVAQAQLLTIDAQTHERREHVLMRFEQSNIKKRRAGVTRTGERVVIDAIDGRAVGIIYATDSAKNRIHHEKIEDPKNLYKKLFDVDLYVERLCADNRPVAYRVVTVHDVIDMPDDEE